MYREKTLKALKKSIKNTYRRLNIYVTILCLYRKENLKKLKKTKKNTLEEVEEELNRIIGEE